MFLPIPAIDLMQGQVVRLSRGRAEAKTVYSDDPVGVARSFEDADARRLHVVDLDGAFKGESANLAIIEKIRAAVESTPSPAARSTRKSPTWPKTSGAFPE